MAVTRGSTEESRERKIALFWTLVRAHETRSPITQEEIATNLSIDVHPVVTTVPRRKLAYDGSDNARRQKFERDKAAIRDLGFEITTTPNDFGVDGYSIDPASVFVPLVDLDDDESQIVGWAAQLLGIGAHGVGRLFLDGPSAAAGVEFSPVLLPLTRAVATRRVIRFRYRKDKDRVREREIAPLEFLYWRGQCYVIGVDRRSLSVKGFRVSRIESVPTVLSEQFHADSGVRAKARSWLPRDVTDDGVSVSVEASAQFARSLEAPWTVTGDGERVDAHAEFESRDAARRAVVALGDHVWNLRPKPVRSDVLDWLKSVNRTPAKPLAMPTFVTPDGTDTLGQTLQLIATVYQSPEPLRAHELAQRCGMDIELVRSIMSRLMALQYLRDPTQYLVHIELGDDDDGDPDDPSYTRSLDYEPRLGSQLSPLTWRDAFELTVALKEAAALYHSDALDRVIAKIDDVVQANVRVVEVEPAYLSAVRDAIDSHQQLKIEYWSVSSDRATDRWVEPRSMASRHGRWYFRAYCRTRDAWLTFRVDRILYVHAVGAADGARPVDELGDWVDGVADDGFEVTLVLPVEQRWILESLPGVSFSSVSAQMEGARLHVRDRRFLDQLMVDLGPRACVLDPVGNDAGRSLANRMAHQL